MYYIDRSIIRSSSGTIVFYHSCCHGPAICIPSLVLSIVAFNSVLFILLSYHSKSTHKSVVLTFLKFKSWPSHYRHRLVRGACIPARSSHGPVLDHSTSSLYYLYEKNSSYIITHKRTQRTINT